ncbi:MAG: orotidine-5'-phosphate decarboxylase [Proteobacteria bacterium]|nr:orotidine-5'-phosphate decarboxylase [Pseudomonadota bacterium]
MAQAGALAAAPRTMIEARKRLIVALDVPSVDEALSIIGDLDGLVSFFKVGLHLQVRPGIEGLIESLGDAGKDIFLDYKLGDIGETMRGGVAGAAARRVRLLTIQGSGDLTEEHVVAALSGKADGLPGILRVTLLTSLGEADAQNAYGKSVQELVMERARQAKAWGCDGVIASGREAKAIKRELGPEFLVVTPGIRPRDAAVGDQKRVVTPGQAIEAGADYLVVGRPIVKSADRRAAAQAIIEEMKAAQAE